MNGRRNIFTYSMNFLRISYTNKIVTAFIRNDVIAIIVSQCSEMTYTVSGGALNSTKTKPKSQCSYDVMLPLRGKRVDCAIPSSGGEYSAVAVPPQPEG